MCLGTELSRRRCRGQGDARRDCPAGLIPALALALFVAVGCRSPSGWRRQADEAAAGILRSTQERALGRTEPITVDSPADSLRRRLLLDQSLPHASPASQSLRDCPDTAFWSQSRHLPPPPDGASVVSSVSGPLRLTLLEALQVAARNSREFQDAKDRLFRTALALDLEADDFRNTFAGVLSGRLQSDPLGSDRRYGSSTHGDLSGSRRFRNGTELSAAIAVDLARVLSQEGASALGLLGDASISVPLLRGSGAAIVGEPLRQAERDMLYAVYDFEQYKREFAVRIASDYLGVLLTLRRVENAEENYRRKITSTRRMRRLADSGRQQEYQFDQSVQDELRAREGWVQAQSTYQTNLDRFKVTLGLPPDASVELSEADLDALRQEAEGLSQGAEVADYSSGVPPADAPVTLQPPTREHAGPWELDEARAIALGLEHRPDLRVAQGRVEDAQRAVMVAADALRAELTLLGTARIGESRSIASAAQADAAWRTAEASYAALLTLDLPIERTRERNQYRNSLIALEQSVRSYQAAEDTVKLDVRQRLRALLLAREGVVIQAQAVRLAERRVRSTDLFLQAGRMAVRDVLEAQDDLLAAQNSLSSAVVSYREAEWELQRDLGLLEVGVDGLWKEVRPERSE
ncbi:MAG: TolC family protein [Lentisphaerae bacterium]|nr:TolC family protein [Lentisphaerota bacterium]